MRFTPKSRRAWRTWLETHHESKSEVWLVFYKRHTGRPTLSYNDAVEEALCFGWIDGVKRSIDEERYTHRFTPRKPESRWSRLNRERAARMQAAGLMLPAGEQAIRRAKRNGNWEGSEQTIDLSMPGELAQRLRANKQAATFFEGLAPSYQRQFIAWINAAKRPETRERRLTESISLLSRGERLGMR
jgi:uncharacterized protein YdeI (YjbR/CyaY-like superfamily)